MATVKMVLSYARTELGITESPAGSNRTRYGKWYGLDGQPWCMMFVQWVFTQARMPLPFKSASCAALLNWYRKYRPGSVVRDPKPGDIVIYNFGHTGIVESADAGTITAIEGNTSPGTAGSQSNGGMVCRRTRKKSTVKAYIRPDYDRENTQKEDEDLDIEKLSDKELVRLAERMQAALARQSIGSTLAPELQEAKAHGITDGSRPGAFCTRAQAAVMTLRALKR